jgi:nucleoside-diphosphate-sugar epimerase
MQPAKPTRSTWVAGTCVAVTGAAGYVGGWLVKLCLERGYSVRACVRNVDDERKTAFLKAMTEYGGRLTLHAADMTVAGAYDTIFEGVHTVFHPAEVFMSAVRHIQLRRQSDDTFTAMCCVL